MSWQTVPLRKLITPNNSRNRPDLPLLSVVRDKGIIKRKLDKSDNHNVIPEDLSNYKVVKEGQFVINKMKAWQGSCGVSPYEGIVSPAYFVFDLDIENPHFFNYSIRSRIFVDEFNRISKGIRVDQWDLELNLLKYVRFPLPPRGEQDQIVRYLDWKVSQINKLINAKRRQIALLGEQKRAVVNKAVTRGGEGWTTRRLKNVSRLKTGSTPSGNEGINTNNDGFNWYTPSDFGNALYLKAAEKSISADIVQRNNTALYDAGSILFIGIGGTTGKVAYCKEPSYSNQQITAIMPQGISGLFLLYYLAAKSQFIKDTANYTTLPIVNNAQLSAVEVLVPPTEEQANIVEHLEHNCSQINTAILKIEEEITLLSDYRTRLISDVVTGKLDVRDVVVPEFEVVEDVAGDVNEVELGENEHGK